MIHPSSIEQAAAINEAVRDHVAACGETAPQFRIYVDAGGVLIWSIGHTGRPEPVTADAVQRTCTKLARAGVPSGSVGLKADGGRIVSLDSVRVLPLNFDPRLTALRDFDPMTVIGRCDACQKGRRVEVQPGRMPPMVGRPRRREWRQGFMLPDGGMVTALGGVHGQGFYADCLHCGEAMHMSPIHGTHNPGKPCSHRCHNATGPACDCACGGANHGQSHHDPGVRK